MPMPPRPSSRVRRKPSTTRGRDGGRSFVVLGEDMGSRTGYRSRGSAQPVSADTPPGPPRNYCPGSKLPSASKLPHNPLPQREDHRLRLRVHVELVVDVADVESHRVDADRQRLRSGLVAVSLGEELQELDLAR